MLHKILIFGLPGSGKTVFANSLYDTLVNASIDVQWQNADKIRTLYDDWDFTDQGRKRQLDRMVSFANQCKNLGIVSICDFVCPRQSYRDIFNADITVWINTHNKSIYQDTNELFETPLIYDFCIDKFEQERYIIQCICDRMRSK